MHQAQNAISTSGPSEIEGLAAAYERILIDFAPRAGFDPKNTSEYCRILIGLRISQCSLTATPSMIRLKVRFAVSRMRQ